MSEPIPLSSVQIDLDYDFLSINPVAVNATLVAGVGTDIVIDCLFLDPFTLSVKLNPTKSKGFGENLSKTEEKIKVKALPMTRLMLSPASAVKLMEQLKVTLEAMNILQEIGD